MPRVGGDDGEAPRERGIVARSLRAEGKKDVSVQSAAALKQESAAPVVGERDFKSDCVRFAVEAGARIHYAIDTAIRRDRDGNRLGSNRRCAQSTGRRE